MCHNPNEQQNNADPAKGKGKKTQSPRSTHELQDLLVTLTDEFTALGE